MSHRLPEKQLGVLTKVLGCIVAMLVLTGCEKFSKDPSMDQNSTALLRMRTHCVGRFLIDLPADFEQHPASDVELYYGLDKNFRKVNVEVLRASGTQPSLDSIVNQRVAELTAGEHFSSPSKTMLALRQVINDEVALVRAYDDARMLDYFKSTLIAQKGTAVGAFKADVFKKDRPEDIEANLLKVVERTSFVDAPGKAGRGTCLGPLLVDAGQDGEVFSLSFRSKNLADAVIHIDMNSMVAKSDGGLLKRWDGNAGLLNKLDFQSSTLRRGKVEIAGLPGEELLSKGKEKGHQVRSFTAETLLLKPASFVAPLVAVSLSMGGQVDGGDYRDASLSEKEALALWDAIIRSIRLRPGSA